MIFSLYIVNKSVKNEKRVFRHTLNKRYETGKHVFLYILNKNAAKSFYEERIKAKKKAEIEARKAAIRTEDIAKGSHSRYYDTPAEKGIRTLWQTSQNLLAELSSNPV